MLTKRNCKCFDIVACSGISHFKHAGILYLEIGFVGWMILVVKYLVIEKVSSAIKI